MVDLTLSIPSDPLDVLCLPHTICVCVLVTQSCLTLATPWTVAHQASLSMEFSRQESWSGLPLPSPGDLPHPEIEPMSLALPALAGRFFTTGAMWEAFLN